MEIKLDTTLERDMDLLIMEEFIASPVFAKIFLDAVNLTEAYTIEHAIHSMRDSDLGESDIVFILKIGEIRHAIHIEDKIDALAMHAQCERYSMRAEKDISDGLYDEYSVFIVAPEKYLAANSEAQRYANHISYETIRAYFATQTDFRSKYKLALIDRAIAEQKNGYQWEANPGVVQFCKAMDNYQKEHYPSIPLGSEAWWRGYKTFLPDAVIVYKANKGFCDLQFSHCTPQQLYPIVKDYLSDGMYIEKAGKSASVRIVVTPVWFESKFEDNLPQVDEALNAISILYKLSLDLVSAKENTT